MNIRETLLAIVQFLEFGHQSGNTHAAIHGVKNSDPAPGPRKWVRPRLVLPTESIARQTEKLLGVSCMSLSDPHKVRMAPPGPVVFDTHTVEVLAIAALQRIQALEAELGTCKDRLQVARENCDQLSAKLQRLQSSPAPVDPTMPRDRDDLQRLLNDAFRRGQEQAHEAHRLAAQVLGGVPELTDEAIRYEWARLHRGIEGEPDEDAFSSFEEGVKQGYALAKHRASRLPALSHSVAEKGG